MTRLHMQARLHAAAGKLAVHIRAHWHHHLGLWGLVAAVFSGAAGVTATHRFAGGYRPSPLPPPIRLAGGALPGRFSLDHWVVRIHNQGDSNSCVGQTAATIEEITAYEATRRPVAMSSGFIWNQLNGGVDQGITYPDAFGLLASQGESTLAAFPADGANDRFSLPSVWVVNGAWPRHIRGFNSISPWDRQTIEAEIHDGRPVAVAIPVYASFYNQFGDSAMPYISGQAGQFLFWHSMTVVGYSDFGVELLNSWSGQWGLGGRAFVSWGFLPAFDAQLVISTPIAGPWHRPPYRFPYAIWNAWASGHHWDFARWIDPHYRGRWSWAATIWSKRRRYTWLRGVKDNGRWFPPTRRRGLGYTMTSFVHGAIFTWPAAHAFKVVRYRAGGRRED